MSDNFEPPWRKAPFRKVNTKELCLLCFSPGENRAVSLASLQRRLKINFKFAGLAPENLAKLEEVEATLCNDCENVVNRFSHLFQQWEKAKMEMDFYVERVNKIILKSSKDVQRVQKYSQKMTSDRETLTQLVFVDEFRKEIANKSFRKKYNERVYLKRTNLTKIEKSMSLKREPSEETEGDIDQSDVTFDSFQDNSPEQSGFGSSSGIIAECKGTSPLSNDSPQFEKKPCTLEFAKMKSSAVEYAKTSIGKYECPACRKPFPRRSNAKRHYKIVHLQTRYKCDICKIAIYTEVNPLKKHQTICKGRKSKLKEKIKSEYHTLNPATTQ